MIYEESSDSLKAASRDSECLTHPTAMVGLTPAMSASRRRNMKPSRPWTRYVRKWDTLLRNVSDLRSQEMRPSWVWQFGWQVGRLQGSLKHLVPPV